MGLMKSLLTIVLLLVSGIAVADKVTDAKIDALDTRIQRIERVVDNQALLSMAQRIQALQREVQELRGENEALSHILATLKDDQRKQYLDIDRRLQSILSALATGDISFINAADRAGISAHTESITNNEALPDTATTALVTEALPNAETTAPATTGIRAPKVAAIPGTTVATAALDDAAQDYKNAFTLLKQGKYEDSIVAFGSFLQIHPDSKYVPNAQYWLAEANYVSRRYPQALLEFYKVIDKYPTSSKIADARLKLAFTYYELEQYEEARVGLTRLRAQFPNSSVASLAKQRLERMSREGK